MDETAAALAELAACWQLKQAHRNFCLTKARTLIARGTPAAEVAAVFGVSDRQLRRWLAELDE